MLPIRPYTPPTLSTGHHNINSILLMVVQSSCRGVQTQTLSGALSSQLATWQTGLTSCWQTDCCLTAISGYFRRLCTSQKIETEMLFHLYCFINASDSFWPIEMQNDWDSIEHITSLCANKMILKQFFRLNSYIISVAYLKKSKIISHWCYKPAN